MKLKQLIQTLETVAPPELAEDWDNIGLLIEPLKPRDIRNILLTIDLTENVAREAVKLHIDFIITYHPLFFGSIRSLDTSNPQARTAMHLIEQGIGVYSPHTALDNAPGGVNDWLAGLLGGTASNQESARFITFSKPIQLSTFTNTVKQQLKLKTVHTASANNRIRTVALCAGAGIETLRSVRADCYLTGEMKHHDVLAAVQNGISIILCGHTETERGYLPVLSKTLRRACGSEVKIMISKTDRAPLQVM